MCRTLVNIDILYENEVHFLLKKNSKTEFWSEAGVDSDAFGVISSYINHNNESRKMFGKVPIY